MTDTLIKQLNESLRDARLAFYLNNVAASDATTKKLKTAQDIYNYWLLDVLVSQDVPTSPVSCAIASLQQYISRILLNMEPGYDSVTITPERIHTWHNEMRKYPIWAAQQNLLYYPEIYLDPSLRNNESDNFQQLKNDLNQGRLQPEAVESAVKAYLTRFEEVSNLKIINGYIDGMDFANSTYYFIAKSRSEHTYFWRSLNMAERPFNETQTNDSELIKQDQPEPYAWTDWTKTDAPIPEDAIEHTIRPVWFNNRLFITWAQCIYQDPANASNDSTNTNPQLLVSYCYKKADDSWSTPRTHIKCFVSNESLGGQARRIVDAPPLHRLPSDELKARIGTVAIHLQEDSKDFLFIAIALFPTQLKLYFEDNVSEFHDKIIRGDDRNNKTPLFLKASTLDKHHNHAPGVAPASYNICNPYSIPHYAITNNIFQSPMDKASLPFFYLQSKQSPIKNINMTRDTKRGASFHTPKISNSDAVQFLDFSTSSIAISDNGARLRQPIRLNTLLATEMTRRAENSLDELFSRETQRLSEPKISSTAPEQPMDFHGPNGRYYTELFLNLPWLIAHRLNAEHQYDEAERWIRYLFDPSLKQSECWKAVPLTGANVPSYAVRAPQDPHLIALSYPVHVRKALYFLYLDILINRGDAVYRELTTDSLSQAKLWYVRALDILGTRPVVELTDQWSPVNLQSLSATPSEKLRAFEYAQTRSSVTSPLPIREDPQQPFLPAIDTPSLQVPFNPELLKRWNIAENRLYNLRHNVDIDGKPLHLPLFAAPLDPRDLVRATSSNSSSGVASPLKKPQIPHYRFSSMHLQALNAVDSVIQFGATLLSLIERKDQADLQERQQLQAWNMAKLSVDLHTQALNIDSKNREVLQASKHVIQGRLSHYQQLLEKDIAPEEAKAGQLYLRNADAEMLAADAQVLAGGLVLAPNIFGLSNGGIRWEGTAQAAGALAQRRAIQDRSTATHLDRTAQFNRRRAEWTATRNQTQLELAQIDAQLAHFAEQEKASRLQLRQAETSLSQSKTNYEFLKKRFTNKQLYQWLNNRFSILYEQAYEATLDVCLAAEACWQYERADFTTRFVQPGAWNTTYRGLGAGEQLKRNLLKMQTAYLKDHQRELEIVKTVSLKRLKQMDTASTINDTWPNIHAALKENGICHFELTNTMFEDDYKKQKHYLRRIKTISISIPALLGAYENIRATLTQTSNAVFLSTEEQEPGIKDLRAKQQIALSTGADDTGLFTLNFNDERYLPFEYTGAVSSWTLTFPNPQAQKAMIESLTDIIVHVSYTARAPGVSR